VRAPLKTVEEGVPRGVTRAPHESGTRLDPLLGSLVGGKFRVERVLADGGMGRVYVATQEPLGRQVALKVVRHDGGMRSEAESQRRFRFEASVLARLHHPSIVTLYDFGDLDGASAGRSYLAMELIEGPTLAARMSAAVRLPLAEVLALAQHMVRGLRFAHGLGVVHRDMKPSNVLLVPDDADGRGVHRVKIVDFGTSKLAAPGAEVPSPRGLTQEGFVIGTLEYMAPEQLEGRPCAASDLFAVGVIMFEALTGVLPFDFAGTVKRRPPLPRLRDVAPDLVVPEAVEELVARLLALSPDERPTSTELLHELRRCADPDASGVRVVSTTAPRRGGHSRLASRLAVVGALACAAGLMVTVMKGAPRGRAPRSVVARSAESMPRARLAAARAKEEPPPVEAPKRPSRAAPRVPPSALVAPAPSTPAQVEPVISVFDTERR
jgi:eukaryotic-like serine/threonine-protein kinase